jgi:hypothetical protein
VYFLHFVSVFVSCSSIKDIPGFPGAADFERFDRYAPFVKHLEISPPNASNYQVRGWRQLSAQAKNRIFLPNLLRLTLSSFPLPSHDQFLWIRSFLSPSINVIIIDVIRVDNLPTVPSLVAASLLGHIGTICPGIQHLQLFPAITRCGTSADSNGYAVADFWENTFYQRLNGLQLRRLGCTTEILSPDWIHVLGNLPLLEGLEVYSISCTIADSKPVSYPAVTHFAVHSTYWHELQEFGKLGLFSGLTSLEISFNEYAAEGTQDDGWEKTFAGLVCNNNPGLAKLAVDFDTMGFSLNSLLLSPLRPMAELPLTDICLKGLTDTTGEVLNAMATLWPRVTRLEMRDLDIFFTFEDLLHFVKLPRLQHLLLCMIMSGSVDLTQLVLQSPASHTLQTLEVNSGIFAIGPDVSSVAQYVLT